MEKQEFFLLLPAIVYGVAVVDLLKIFRHKHSYWEMIAWGGILMVYIVIVWLELWLKLDYVAANKWFFIMTIVQAIILAQTAAIITPEEKDTDTESYFMGIRTRYFLMMGALVLTNLVIQEFFYDDERPLVFRLGFISIFLLCAFVDKKWLRTISLAVILTLLVSVILRI